MIAACLEAQHITGDTRWSDRARWVFNWFVGENQLKQALYDPRTGGCRDGLHEDRVNENQGAESSLSFMASLLEMRAAHHDHLRVAKERGEKELERAHAAHAVQSGPLLK